MAPGMFEGMGDRIRAQVNNNISNGFSGNSVFSNHEFGGGARHQPFSAGSNFLPSMDIYSPARSDVFAGGRGGQPSVQKIFDSVEQRIDNARDGRNHASRMDKEREDLENSIRRRIEKEFEEARRNFDYYHSLAVDAMRSAGGAARGTRRGKVEHAYSRAQETQGAWGGAGRAASPSYGGYDTAPSYGPSTDAGYSSGGGVPFCGNSYEGSSARRFTKIGEYKNAGLSKPEDSGDLTIMGPPTISARIIDEVLEENGSPMAGQGQEIYDRCVAAGVDPAIALGFFSVESTYGTAGLATQNRNFGNIRSSDGGFRNYASWMDGLDDWLNLMVDEYADPQGFNAQTVDEAIPIYAPASDNNNPAEYIGAVRSRVEDWRERSAPDLASQRIPGKVTSHARALQVGDDTTDFFFTQFAHERWNPTGPAYSSDCGPATLAMACKYFGVTPNGADMNDPNSLISESRLLMTGTYGSRAGMGMLTRTSELRDAAAGLGMKPADLPTINDIDAALAAGAVIAADGNPVAYNYNMTANQYATNTDGSLYNGGHLALIVAGDGKYYQLNDPAYKGEQLIISRQELQNYLSADGNEGSVALFPPG